MQTIEEMRSTRQGLLDAIEDVNRQLEQINEKDGKAYLWALLAMAVAAVILLCATGGLAILPLLGIGCIVLRKFGVDPEKTGESEEEKRLKVRREKLQAGLYELEEKLHAKEKEERECNQRKD